MCCVQQTPSQHSCHHASTPGGGVHSTGLAMLWTVEAVLAQTHLRAFECVRVLPVYVEASVGQ